MPLEKLHALQQQIQQMICILGKAVSLVINGALALEGRKELLERLDPERAEIVMLRY